MIACFGPSYLVALSFIFLNLSLTTFDLLGIFFLTCSIFIMGYAHSKQSSPSTSPSWRYFLYAFFGTFLDSLGVFFSKMAFMHTKELHPLSVGFFRVLFSFLLLSATFRWIFRSPLSLELHSRHRRLLILASFCGTFLTLAFYNYALSKEHPAIVAALGSLAPLYSSLYESWRDKKPLSWSLIFSLLLMLIGIGFSTHAFSLLFS
jgi:drug/metabolite transporter (DMT)-like permease